MLRYQRFVYTTVRGCDCVVPRWIYREWAEGGLRQLIQDFGLDRSYSNPVEEQALRNITRFSFALRRFYLDHSGIRKSLTTFERTLLYAERAVMNKHPRLRDQELIEAICYHLGRQGIEMRPRELQGWLHDISQKLIDLQAIQDQAKPLNAEIQQWYEYAQALLDAELAAEA